MDTLLKKCGDVTTAAGTMLARKDRTRLSQGERNGKLRVLDGPPVVPSMRNFAAGAAILGISRRAGKKFLVSPVGAADSVKKALI
jgi:hypothetical protein